MVKLYQPPLSGTAPRNGVGFSSSAATAASRSASNASTKSRKLSRSCTRSRASCSSVEVLPIEIPHRLRLDRRSHHPTQLADLPSPFPCRVQGLADHTRHYSTKVRNPPAGRVLPR